MIQYLRKVSPKKLKGVAILRLDFNTEDDWRMKAALPIINFLLKHASAVVILSHKGRPLGFQREFSLKQSAHELESLLKKDIVFFNSFNFVEMKMKIQAAKHGSIFMLENLRFMPGEASNNTGFAKNLASLGNYYVNDAFAVSHRVNASVSAITKFLPSYAGLGLESEIVNLSKVMERAKRPLVIILGGVKINDKLGVIKFFSASGESAQGGKHRADSFLIGGALANTLLYLKGAGVGKSLYEKRVSKDIKRLAQYKNIVLPRDYRTDNSAILDIGPETEKIFEKKIHEARTIVWNGPLGMTERPAFTHGTMAVAKAVADNAKAFSIVGGGETVMSIKKYNIDDKISFISTGGGAMLDFLAGLCLPGLSALGYKKKTK
ncbi:MAG TPA: phosphoglycerate kinase [Candidatus Paceibacterota bacterium]